jgi:ABC-type uncharacterized transport system permease subunit
VKQNESTANRGDVTETPKMANKLRNIGIGFLRVFLSILLGLITGVVLLLVFGYEPIPVMIELVRSIVNSRVSLIDTVLQAIPILLISLGVCLSYHGKLWNIGGEGQFYIGAVTATTVALSFPDLSGWILLPVILIAGFVGGATWSCIAGALRAYRNANETVVTLMLNSIATFIVGFAVRVPLREVGSPVEQTARLSSTGQLPRFAGSRIHIGLIVALVLVPVVHYFLFRTSAGYRIRMVGEKPEVSKAAGVPTRKVILMTFLISGGLAGLGGAVHVSGVTHRLLLGISNRFGSTAILVALMARRNPLLAGVIAFVFTALTVGGEGIQVAFGIPSDFIQVFLGILLLFVLAADEFLKRRWEIL